MIKPLPTANTPLKSGMGCSIGGMGCVYRSKTGYKHIYKTGGSGKGGDFMADLSVNLSDCIYRINKQAAPSVSGMSLPGSMTSISWVLFFQNNKEPRLAILHQE